MITENNLIHLGAVFRSYATTHEQVGNVVERALASAHTALALKDDDGKHLFAQVVFVVPTDHDCGETSSALHDAFASSGELSDNRLTIVPTPGHHSAAALTSGVTTLAQKGITHALIISNKAVDHLTTENIHSVLDALKNGFKVVGVDIPVEHTPLEPIQPIQNTFAVWEIHSLLEAGGFVSEDGVEEVVPLIKLLQAHGPCAAIIKSHVALQAIPRDTVEGLARHREVWGTKAAAQRLAASTQNVTLEWLIENIKLG